MVYCETCKAGLKKYQKGYGKKCSICFIKSFTTPQKQDRLRNEKG